MSARFTEAARRGAVLALGLELGFGALGQTWAATPARAAHAQAKAHPAPGSAHRPAAAAASTPAAPAVSPALKVGDGLLVGDPPHLQCVPICGFPHLTDPDADGNLDGFGYEGQRTCIADGTTLALSSPRCDVVPLPNPPPPGNGIYRETRCVPVCSSSLTDFDPKTGHSDGWGYERRRDCIVAGTAAALGGLPCDPDEKPFPAGDGIDVVVEGGKRECRPFCRNPAQSDPDGDGFGFEFEQSCVVSASVPALQGIPCDAPDLPPPPPPPPPPPGAGWRADYTATMFGEIDCARLGFDDPGDSDLNRSTCISSGKVSLNDGNRVYFAATGDLSSLWSGEPCVCKTREEGGVCRTPPACPDQGNCGQCVEVTCDSQGRHSFQDDGLTHDEFCRPGHSVVVQLIDACPHNHPNNPYWCTRARPEHIDLSCSAFRALTVGRSIAQIGSINVQVRPISCAIGLGEKTF
ncbi:MAG TPA: hypothetical protein VG963_10730 [Polyangiaceae bacterium]|nr:hypothetical protein [Polyangiaceae bacterium]